MLVCWNGQHQLKVEWRFLVGSDCFLAEGDTDEAPLVIANRFRGLETREDEGAREGVVDEAGQKVHIDAVLAGIVAEDAALAGIVAEDAGADVGIAPVWMEPGDDNAGNGPAAIELVGVVPGFMFYVMLVTDLY